MPAITVLLVDESLEDRALISRWLSEAVPGVEILPTADAESLKGALTGDVDAVVTESSLSWIDGVDVAALARRRWPDAVIVMHARTATVDKAVGAMKAGADDFVVKSADDFAPFVSALSAGLQRREARRRSEEDEKRFRLLFEHAPVGIIRTNREGRVIEANAMAATILGRESPAELDARSIEELCGCDGESPAWLKQVREGCSVTAMEVSIPIPDGTRRWVRMSARPLLAAQGGDGCEILFDDITLRYEERERMAQVERQLHHAQKMEAIGRLAGGVAHDFNNLLTVILGHASLVQDGMRAGRAVAEDLQPVIQAGRRAAELTRQLLALSHAQPGKERIVQPAHVLEETSKLLGRLIGEDIKLVTRSEGNGRIRIDPGQLGQILMNLAVNSRDAMPHGGQLELLMRDVELDADAASLIAGLSAGPHVEIRVIDTGEGIPPGIVSQVFEPFFTTKEPGVGTGLGLSIVHGIVRQWDGGVTIDSVVGRGTTFRFLFPVTQDAAVASRGTQGPAAAGGPETILVTEDDDNLRSLVVRALRQSGYAVLEASDGTEALELARRHEGAIHLLLTDVVMPLLTGPELADRLRQMRPEVGVVLMSGYAGDRVRRRVAVPADTPWLDKPFTLEALRQVVRTTLDAGRN